MSIHNVNSDVSMSMPIHTGIAWVIRTAIFIAVIFGITELFYVNNWNWTLYAVIIGIIFGLLIGLIVIVTISTKVQIATVGAFAGMGIDLAASFTKQDGPSTAINALAGLVAKTAHAATSAAKTTGLPNPLELPISVGIWVFICVLGITMLIASLETNAT